MMRLTDLTTILGYAAIVAGIAVVVMSPHTAAIISAFVGGYADVLRAAVSPATGGR